jgi:multiple sugar transport system permease protein
MLKSKDKQGLVFISPALFTLIFIVIFPLLYSLAYSFTNLELKKPQTGNFVAFENYKYAILDETFWSTILTTVYIVGIAVIIEMLLGIAVASLLNAKVHNKNILGKNFFRLAFIIPMLIPPVVVGYTFGFMFNEYFGIITYLVNILGFRTVPWLTNPRLAQFLLMIIDIWRWTPFVVLFILSGLEGIPDEIREAAKVDGAGAGRLFLLIVLPLLRPIILLTLLFRIIDGLKLFDEIYVLTGGGPGRATETFTFYLYDVALKYTKVGLGASMSFILMIIISLLLIALTRNLSKEVN